MLITSVHNPRVKDAARLHEHRARLKQGRIVIDGVREIARALQAGVELLETFVCEALCQSGESQALLRELAASGAQRYECTPEIFKKVAYGQRAEGIVAVAHPPRRRLADCKLPSRPLVALLEGIEKPGNLGAVVRSADGAGAAAVFVAGAGEDIYHPNAIRASLGTIFTLPVYVAPSEACLAFLREQAVPMFAARLDADEAYLAADYSRGAALMLGSEAAGVSKAFYAADIRGVRLPMLGAADSLNVSATSAVLLYHARAQLQRH